MKKILGKVLVVLFCIGLLGSCGSEEETLENVERSQASVAVFDTEEEIEELTELPIIENEELQEEVVEEPENSVEEIAAPVEEVVETPVAEKVVEVKEPEYSYTSLNKTMYASQTVNVRNLPTKDGEKVGGLSTAQAVLVTGKCNETGWYRIEYNGSEAYVSDNYLVDEKPVQQKAVTQPSNNTANSSSSSSVTVPTHEDTVGNLVWVPVNGGKKYHSRSGCSNMENPMQVTVDHAQALGYTACKKCH